LAYAHGGVSFCWASGVSHDKFHIGRTQDRL
jgi:hypothetical protein